jgi:hypothetical protein
MRQTKVNCKVCVNRPAVKSQGEICNICRALTTEERAAKIAAREARLAALIAAKA